MFWCNSQPHPATHILTLLPEYTGDNTLTMVYLFLLSLSLIFAEWNIIGHPNGKCHLVYHRKNNTAVNMWAGEMSPFMTVIEKKTGSNCFPLRKIKGSCFYGFVPLRCWVFPLLQNYAELFYHLCWHRRSVLMPLILSSIVESFHTLWLHFLYVLWWHSYK